MFSLLTIYQKYTQLPCVGDPTPDTITENLCFWPYFADAIGTIDGTHILCTCLLKSMKWLETGKVLHCKIAWFAVTLRWNSHMSLVAGKDQPLMQQFIMMPMFMNSPSPTASTLPIPDFQAATNSLYCFMVSGTTLLNGDMVRLSEPFFLLFALLTHDPGQSITVNTSTYATLSYTTLSNILSAS